MTLNSVVDIINSNIQINKIYKGGHNPISLLHSMDEKNISQYLEIQLIEPIRIIKCL